MDHAREAYLAGTLLALGIQKINVLTSEKLRDVRLHVGDSLRKMSVSPDLFDLEQFKTLAAADAVEVVVDMKSDLGTAIGKSCGDFASGLFLLTFDFVLVSTDPQHRAHAASALLQRAVELGFETDAFKKILTSLRTKPDEAVAEYEKLAEVLISKRAGESKRKLRDAFKLKPLKPQRGGFEVDLKLLWALVKNYFRRVKNYFRRRRGS
jgi:hypothetical protein